MFIERACVEFTGVLDADAQVRMRAVGQDGQMVPVLCLELVAVGPGRHRLHAEQVYPAAAHEQAERRARTMRKGMTVRVTHALDDLRLTLPHIERVECEPVAEHGGH